MFQFDLASLPPGAIVTQVGVRLHVTRQPDPNQPPGPVASDFSLHRMLVSWGEGSGRRFASIEQSDNLNPAPELIITYIIPEPSAAALLMLTLAAAAFRRGR